MMENMRVEVPIIQMGLSGIEPTGTIPTLTLKPPQTTELVVSLPMVGSTRWMALLIVKPGPTQVDHPVSSLQSTTVNSLPSKVTQPVDKAGTIQPIDELQGSTSLALHVNICNIQDQLALILTGLNRIDSCATGHDERLMLLSI
jgi:hypothetical protein